LRREEGAGEGLDVPEETPAEIEQKAFIEPVAQPSAEQVGAEAQEVQADEAGDDGIEKVQIAAGQGGVDELLQQQRRDEVEAEAEEQEEGGEEEHRPPGTQQGRQLPGGSHQRRCLIFGFHDVEWEIASILVSVPPQ